ncbi:hypothetical protein [Shewanella gaetbuli]
MKFIAAILVVLNLTACANGFSRVDFKYTSASHLNFKQSSLNMSLPPDELVAQLSNSFSRQGARVLIREQLDHILKPTLDSYGCWEAKRAITEQEFAAFTKNSFSDYKNINRDFPYKSRNLKLNCNQYEQVTVKDANSWLLMVEFPPVTANKTIYRPSVNNFFIASQSTHMNGFSISEVPENVSIQIFTRLYIFLRAMPNGGSEVYLEARPVSGQVEASDGASIGWSWWRLSSAFEERDIVRSYKILLEDYDRAVNSPASL